MFQKVGPMTSIPGAFKAPFAERGAPLEAFADMVARHRTDMREIVRSKLRLLRADASPLQDLDRPLDALYEWLSHLSDEKVVQAVRQSEPGAVIALSKLQNRFRSGAPAHAIAPRSPAAF